MAKTKPKAAPEAEPESAGSVMAPFRLPYALVEEMRDAVAATPGETMASLGETAIRRELARRVGARGGEAFPKRSEGVKRGRPFGS